MVKAVLSSEIIELFFLLLIHLFLAVLFLLLPGRWAGTEHQPPAALQRKKRCAHQCCVGIARLNHAAKAASCCQALLLRGAVAPRCLFSRQVSVGFSVRKRVSST